MCEWNHTAKGSERRKGHQQQGISRDQEKGDDGEEGASAEKFGGKGNATLDEQVDVRHYGLAFPWCTASVCILAYFVWPARGKLHADYDDFFLSNQLSLVRVKQVGR
jgi:hypothetical protein